jgi:hypothetical protein
MHTGVKMAGAASLAPFCSSDHLDESHFLAAPWSEFVMLPQPKEPFEERTAVFVKVFAPKRGGPTREPRLQPSCSSRRVKSQYWQLYWVLLLSFTPPEVRIRSRHDV